MMLAHALIIFNNAAGAGDLRLLLSVRASSLEWRGWCYAPTRGGQNSGLSSYVEVQIQGLKIFRV